MKVNLLIVAALAAVAQGLSTASLAASVTDSAGVSQTVNVPLSAFTVVRDGNGNDTGSVSASVQFTNDVPVGSFSGSVQAVQADGSNVGDGVSFTGTVVNNQLVPTTVTVSMS